MGSMVLGAKKVTYQAAYGFDKDGVATLLLEEPGPEATNFNKGPNLLHAMSRSRLMECENGTYALPGRSLPGANKRLRDLLEIERVDYRNGYTHADTGIHVGPDGSQLCADDHAYGVPPWMEGDYFELKYARYPS